MEPDESQSIADTPQDVPAAARDDVAVTSAQLALIRLQARTLQALCVFCLTLVVFGWVLVVGQRETDSPVPPPPASPVPTRNTTVAPVAKTVTPEAVAESTDETPVVVQMPTPQESPPAPTAIVSVEAPTPAKQQIAMPVMVKPTPKLRRLDRVAFDMPEVTAIESHNRSVAAITSPKRRAKASRPMRAARPARSVFSSAREEEFWP